MRLIDADSFELNMQKEWERNEISNGDWMLIRQLINEEPTVERETGEWVDIHEDESVACRDCHKRYDWTTEAQYYNYCPNCGARMKGEGDEHLFR